MRPGFVIAAALLSLCCSTLAAEQKIGFNQSIRPILSDNCFACHGPDAKNRKGKLRLDLREAVLEKKAIIPGDPNESELIKRIFAHDPDDLMPPAESHKVLTTAQKELLRDWVSQGAAYEGHWSYIPPVKPSTPAGKNAIDHLVEARLNQIGLPFSAEADGRTLARRVSFDLAGLPPTPEVVANLEKAVNAETYSSLVEKLLSSPEFGERMAIPWLDVVRFADTIGYHSDNPRNIWPYRDYVISAFNENKPFDQFTIEQLAGDLLPGATAEQKVASAFNRLLLSTEEGGAQPKDYEARMLTDRVRAVSAVWLGQTIGCAQCHDHKFDPTSQRDFYALGAFFADIKEPIIGRREDGMLVPNKKQATQLARLESDLNRVQKDYDAEHPELKDSFAKWEQAQRQAAENDRFWRPLPAGSMESAGGAKLEMQKDASILVKGKKPEKDVYTLTFADVPNPISGLRIEALPHDSLPAKGSGRANNGNFVVTEIIAAIIRDGKNIPIELSSARASFEQVLAAEANPDRRWTSSAVIDGNTNAFGWAVLPEVNKPQEIVLELADPIKLAPEDKVRLEIVQNHGGGHHTLGHFRVSASSSYDAVRAPLSSKPSPELAALLGIPSDKRDEEQRKKLFTQFKSNAPEFAALRQQLAEARKSKVDFEATIPRCIVSMQSEQPRTVRILPRGNFLIETGDLVTPAIPHFLQTTLKSTTERSLNRLDLAEWLVSPQNPLTARVTMNRLWKQFFGIGLSKVLDDLGAQGEPPPNQALLDWLACEFMDSGWDLKHMVRLIVNSRTYKQSSQASPSLHSRDPFNRELAAQTRWRLDAELVRDNALAVSGLLAKKIGGPSVKPYQPDGYWENLNFPQRTYGASAGADQYRRGLYTWWQRSYAHPAMLAFDAPTREECAAERNRSNIPQQSLVLLNDPSFVEASRVFATRILKECAGNTTERIEWAWRQALQRTPRPDEVAAVEALLQKHLAEYQSDEKAAGEFLKVGLSPVPTDLDRATLAAWTNVARVIFNLHETITRS